SLPWLTSVPGGGCGGLLRPARGNHPAQRDIAPIATRSSESRAIDFVGGSLGERKIVLGARRACSPPQTGRRQLASPGSISARWRSQRRAGGGRGQDP